MSNQTEDQDPITSLIDGLGAVSLGTDQKPEDVSLPNGTDQNPNEDDGGYGYDDLVAAITTAATAIQIGAPDKGSDGRIDSAKEEKPFLQELKRMLLEKDPTWNICIEENRSFCDITINNLHINLKLTECKTADNASNKRAIFYSITGSTKYPKSSNWNQFLHNIKTARSKNRIKAVRDRATEYHYLVKNKTTGGVLFRPIFDIHTYFSNPSNILQIHWGKEFENSDYRTDDADYMKKVKELILCIQRSVAEQIRNNQEFANEDIESLFSTETAGSPS